MHKVYIIIYIYISACACLCVCVSVTILCADYKQVFEVARLSPGRDQCVFGITKIDMLRVYYPKRENDQVNGAV